MKKIKRLSLAVIIILITGIIYWVSSFVIMNALYGVDGFERFGGKYFIYFVFFVIINILIAILYASIEKFYKKKSFKKEFRKWIYLFLKVILLPATFFFVFSIDISIKFDGEQFSSIVLTSTISIIIFIFLVFLNFLSKVKNINVKKVFTIHLLLWLVFVSYFMINFIGFKRDFSKWMDKESRIEVTKKEIELYECLIHDKKMLSYFNNNGRYLSVTFFGSKKSIRKEKYGDGILWNLFFKYSDKESLTRRILVVHKETMLQSYIPSWDYNKWKRNLEKTTGIIWEDLSKEEKISYIETNASVGTIYDKNEAFKKRYNIYLSVLKKCNDLQKENEEKENTQSIEN